MTNKRQIKKYISRVGMDVAQTILPAAVITKAITEEKAEEVLTEISRLQAEVHKRLSIDFDKAPEAFEDMRKYHAARSAYFRKAYAKAVDDFEKGVTAALEPVNKAFNKK